LLGNGSGNTPLDKAMAEADMHTINVLFGSDVLSAVAAETT
jgi:hypothetical protein